MQRYDLPGESQNDANAAPDFPADRIPQATSLNQTIHPTRVGISDEIIFDLPPFLADACQDLDRTERDVFLVTALGVLSGCLPNIYGVYDGRRVYPHLFVYLLGGYGSGKGAAELARALGAAIDADRKEQTRWAMAAYKTDLAGWKEAAHPKGEMPEKPGRRLLFIPADNRRGGLFQLLEENGESGIVFETEGDTLADTLTTEHGAFSDLLRKAFHHEPATLFRKTLDEFRDLKAPCLAVVLTSTADQMRRLIPSPENGLLSRFCFFELTPDFGFKDVFAEGKRDRSVRFANMGSDVKRVHDRLSLATDGIEFRLTIDQQKRFVALFGDTKEELVELDAALAGTANRLGLIAFRLAMILTAVRSLKEDDNPKTLACSDQDFNNALRLAAVFRATAQRVYHSYPKRQDAGEPTTVFEVDLVGKAAKFSQAKRMRDEGKKPLEIAAELGIKKTTIYRWLSEYQ